MNDGRIEKLLKAILGQEVQLEPRESRVERLLYAILTGGSHDEPTLSEMEDILLCILHGERYDGPTSSRINDMLKVKANGGSYDEPRLSRIEELIYEWINGGDISTYTGTLPATLQTVAGYLESYKIWGNTGGVGVKTESAGYKLPIISNDTVTDIYIGDTQLAKNEYADSETGKIYRWADITGLSDPLFGIDTHADELALFTETLTRKIKKLVLTGSDEEGWKYNETYKVFSLTVSNLKTSGLRKTTFFCSHYIVIDDGRSIYDVPNNAIYTDQVTSIYIMTDAYTSIENFKAYLQQQYVAGTPVTVWYVLTEPEISTVPVPSGLTGTIEGYLIQDGTPTPEAPVYPTANGTKQEDGTYSIESAYLTPTDPPAQLPKIPTFAGETTISYGGAGVQPEKVELKYRK